jgi:predicted amidophosphoribosyltransferase
MSRHLDNAGKPRPPVEWTVTYGCVNGHTLEAVECCDGCAASLVDGRQRCARCFRTMVVTLLARPPR